MFADHLAYKCHHPAIEWFVRDCYGGTVTNDVF